MDKAMREITILIADDDKDIVDIIDRILRTEGYGTVRAYDGVEALDAFCGHEISLAILDVMMPGLDGMELTEKIREHFNVPILMLSARTKEADRICGLTVGADDYLGKPFHKGELLARVRALLRRYFSLGSAGQEPDEETVVYYDLLLNLRGKSLTVRGDEVRLTGTEYRLMELLMKNIGKVFTVGELYEQIWNQEPYDAGNSVMICVNRLRKKIEINPKKPDYLKVVWGIGYKIER